MAISHGWEALRGDPLPWLLDPRRPNLHWRVLVELFQRPLSSPAVVRARGGADAAEPVATLIADFNPEEGWPDTLPVWSTYDGAGWRAVAAVQWGADPTDPRLHGAAERLLRAAESDVGSGTCGSGPRALRVARTLQSLAVLGWCREPRFRALVTWLEEGAESAEDGGWADQSSESCPVTAVAVAGLVASCGEPSRRGLAERAAGALAGALESPSDGIGHPCLDDTDDAEILHALARLDAPLTETMKTALGRLQQQQVDGGRWLRTRPVPASLLGSGCPATGVPSAWVTLKSLVAVLHYAVVAGLPRMYPARPA